MPDETPKSKCGICGKDMIWAPDVQQWYCNTCQRYFEPSTSTKSFLDKAIDKINIEIDGKTYRCEKCGYKISFVQQYQKWYCGYCQEYK
jgi:ribosomal protein S27AE